LGLGDTERAMELLNVLKTFYFGISSIQIAAIWSFMEWTVEVAMVPFWSQDKDVRIYSHGYDNSNVWKVWGLWSEKSKGTEKVG